MPSCSIFYDLSARIPSRLAIVEVAN